MRVLRRTSAWLAVLALLAGACSGDPDPQAELTEAFEATFADSVAFELTAQADPDALGALGEDGLAASAFLGTFAVAGTSADGASSLRVQLFGRDLLDLRRIGPDRTYARLALGDVPGVPPELLDPTSVLPALRQLDLGQEVEDAVRTLLAGAWLAVDGALDLASFAEIADGTSSAPEDAEPGLRGDLVRQLPRYLEVRERSEADGRRTFRVDVRIGELLAAAGQQGAVDAPAILPGSVFLEDGVVTRIRIDISDLTGGAPTDPDAGAAGRVELQLDLEDHGEVRPLPAPDATTTISAEAFLEGVSRLMRFATGLGVGPSS